MNICVTFSYLLHMVLIYFSLVVAYLNFVPAILTALVKRYEIFKQEKDIHSLFYTNEQLHKEE